MVLTALAYGVIPFQLAVVGAATTARWRPGPRLRSAVQHIAAGVVFAAVASEVVPDIAQRHSPTAAVRFALGTAVVLGLRQLHNRADATGDTSATSLIAAVGVDVRHRRSPGRSRSHRRRPRRTVTDHGAQPRTALPRAHRLRPDLQNSPPRTAIATTAPLAALLPAGAVAGSAALAGRGPVPISVVLGFATAALLYLVTEELLAEAHETTETPLLTAAFFIGFITFLTLELSL